MELTPLKLRSTSSTSFEKYVNRKDSSSGDFESINKKVLNKLKKDYKKYCD